MTILLNIIHWFIYIIGMYFVWKAYKKKDIKAVIIAVVLTVVLGVLYNLVQPSYIPKTTVQPLQRYNVEKTHEPEIRDITLKPRMNTEEREEHFNNILSYKKDVQEILNK